MTQLDQTIANDVSLKPFNSFGIDCHARWLAHIKNQSDLIALLKNAAFDSVAKLVLGGGSNILFTQNFPGLVIKIEIPGIDVINETANYVILKIGAGVIWHDLVKYCLAHNYAGIENLSLIPGTVGAAPIQNIGAYGVELKEVFKELTAIDIHTGKARQFNQEDCQFNYRDSYFKQHKNQYVITDVTLQLNKHANINSSYGAIQTTLHAMNIQQPTIQDISQAVISIRQAKLPDPKIIGNAGSFFKNPIIEQGHFKKLHTLHPDIPNYPADSKHIKIPAAWLIEKCQLKGMRCGNVGVHDKQAVVLVNHGGGTGKELQQLANTIQTKVLQLFEIHLTPEVNII